MAARWPQGLLKRPRGVPLSLCRCRWTSSPPAGGSWSAAAMRGGHQLPLGSGLRSPQLRSPQLRSPQLSSPELRLSRAQASRAQASRAQGSGLCSALSSPRSGLTAFSPQSSRVQLAALTARSSHSSQLSVVQRPTHTHTHTHTQRDRRTHGSGGWPVTWSHGPRGATTSSAALRLAAEPQCLPQPGLGRPPVHPLREGAREPVLARLVRLRVALACGPHVAGATGCRARWRRRL